MTGSDSLVVLLMVAMSLDFWRTGGKKGREGLIGKREERCDGKKLKHGYLYVNNN